MTPRQLQILHMLAEGKQVTEIAKELWISMETAKTHCRAVRRKLGAINNANAVHLAWQQGLLGGDS